MNSKSVGNRPQRQTITRVLQTARARRGLTQAVAADLVGVTPRWYRNLEGGRRGPYSDAMLTAVGKALELSEEEWMVLYRLAGGEDLPAEIMSPQRQNDPAPPEVRKFVEGLRPWGAYACDHRWDVLAYNAPLLDLFPWIREGANIMEGALTQPEARTRLISWETDWALPMIAQLRLHAEQWPADHRLRAITESVRADPTARRLWESPNLPTPACPSTQTKRRLYTSHSGSATREVTFMPLMPLERPWYRFMAVIPV
ncbi:helix-turn-helix domain-containing protein [Streptomyces zagrosensis]|uniref:Transcriptional regulator with XRE-family HTH domain n=1 Tax=Streptomyces zagrosensis TaxID=1042984 RepID=A0A7W9QGS7_9ACTN|nr:helix-turn-helix domain-containing protein [Streptomyces zagrosensis]MBB5940000.1 transcriptional regulator with XRE-family HTH domain [Streptomyces zagrosensis]